VQTPQPQTGPAPSSQQSFLRPHATGSSRSSGRSLLRQFAEQIDQLASDFERRTNVSDTRLNVPQRTGASWSTYHGRTAPSMSSSSPRPAPARNVPPALPPRHRTSSSTSLPETTSEFTRDFYAAGPGRGLISESDGNGAPSTSTAARSPPNDRGPTTVPTPGRPLLCEGNLLVYPRGHFCEKCTLLPDP
jgi:hypothetical protein